MNRIILSIFRKEITHILRDPQSLAMVLLMPILMLVLYGYAITLDMKGITTAIIDESRTTESRSLVQRLSGIDAFHITARDLPLDAIDGLFKSQAARCVLVIPSDYASKLVAKGGTEVELIIDASDPNAANFINNYVGQIIAAENASRNGSGRVLMAVSPRVFYNPDMRSVNFFVPGLIAVILILISTLLTSVAIVREKETGTMEQILVSPIKPGQMIVGKVLPYTVTGFMVGVLITSCRKPLVPCPDTRLIRSCFGDDAHLHRHGHQHGNTCLDNIENSTGCHDVGPDVHHDAHNHVERLHFSGIKHAQGAPVGERNISGYLFSADHPRHRVEGKHDRRSLSAGRNTDRDGCPSYRFKRPAFPGCDWSSLMRRILFVIQKEFRQILRTRAYFSMLFIVPFVQLIIMGSALSTDVKHVPLTIVDYDHSRMSREIVEAGSSTASFDFKGMAASEREATAMLDKGRARMAFVIPPHFEREVKSLRKPEVEVLIDGVDGNSAGVSLGYATAMLGQVQAGWARTMAPEASVQAAETITAVPRMWYNPNLDSKFNFVPGLMGMLLIIVTTFLSANNIVREKEIGTLEQIMVTPLTGLQLIIGKIVPFMTLGLVQMTVTHWPPGWYSEYG